MNVKRTTVAAISLTDCVSTLQEVIIADVNLDTNYKKTAKSRAKVKKKSYTMCVNRLLLQHYGRLKRVSKILVFTREIMSL